MKKEKSVILVVDDKPANVLALVNLLANEERTLLAAASGKEALRISLDQHVDLVILDVQMPVMNGFEVAQLMKSHNRTKHIPVIFATAESRERNLVMQGYEEGAVDYFLKPLDPDIVKAKVSVLLQIQSQKRELVEKNATLEKSALLINNSADIIGIIDGQSFELEEMNPAFTSILGYQPGEIAGRKLQDFLQDKDMLFLNDTGYPVAGELSFDAGVLCSDTSLKWLQWKVVISKGKWYVNARDITEIKKAEKIRTYLGTIVKQSKDAIYIQNENGNIISWNEGAEKMYGYTEQEALTMTVWDMAPAEQAPALKSAVDRLLMEGKIETQQCKRITKEGRPIDVLFSAALIKDSFTNENSITITERDITEQLIADEHIRQLNAKLKLHIQQLQASYRDMESFSYSVSHDLRAPLRALNAYSQIIEKEYMDSMNDEAKRLMKNIHANAEKMATLIDDLLAFSKLGRKEINRVQSSMSKIVNDVIEDMLRCGDIKASLSIGLLPVANVDERLFAQVWQNLISNAVKYSARSPNPVIQIGAKAGEDSTVYFIKDNGTGFNMKYAHKLFGVFQRLHGPEFEGTGVGLAIAHRIVTKHGGKIWAESSPGEGAVFYFSLPG